MSESSSWLPETQVDNSPEANQHPTTPTDLRFKLNKMRFKVATLHGDPESLQADGSGKSAREHHAPAHKENASPTIPKTKDASVFTPLKLPIDQILHIIKHQPWIKLPKTAKHDIDSLKIGNCSFHDSWGDAI